MNRTSTFKMAIWIMIFVGSALSVKTRRRNSSRQLTIALRPCVGLALRSTGY